MSHLGERVTALVDGRLSPDAEQRAYLHAAGCRPCRDAIEAERLLTLRLASLFGPEPGADLVGRLMALGGPAGPLPPRTGRVPGSPRGPLARLDPTTVPSRVTAAGPAAPWSITDGSPASPRPGRRSDPLTRPAGRAAAPAGPARGRAGGRSGVSSRVAALIGAVGIVSAGAFGVGVADARLGGPAPAPLTQLARGEGRVPARPTPATRPEAGVVVQLVGRSTLAVPQAAVPPVARGGFARLPVERPVFAGLATRR